MRKFKVAQITSSRAVKRNLQHSKVKLYTVNEIQLNVIQEYSKSGHAAIPNNNSIFSHSKINGKQTKGQIIVNIQWCLCFQEITMVIKH